MASVPLRGPFPPPCNIPNLHRLCSLSPVSAASNLTSSPVPHGYHPIMDLAYTPERAAATHQALWQQGQQRQAAKRQQPATSPKKPRSSSQPPRHSTGPRPAASRAHPAPQPTIKSTTRRLRSQSHSTSAARAGAGSGRGPVARAPQRRSSDTWVGGDSATVGPAPDGASEEGTPMTTPRDATPQSAEASVASLVEAMNGPTRAFAAPATVVVVPGRRSPRVSQGSRPSGSPTAASVTRRSVGPSPTLRGRSMSPSYRSSPGVSGYRSGSPAVSYRNSSPGGVRYLMMRMHASRVQLFGYRPFFHNWCHSFCKQL